MKLLTKYIRINILLVISVFLLSSIALYFVINKTLVHELDEELHGVQLNIERYIKAKHIIPENSILYDYHLDAEEVRDTALGDYRLTVLKYIPHKEGNRHFRRHVFYVSNAGKLYKITVEKQIEGMRIMARNNIKLSLATILCVIVVLMLINRIAFNRIWRPFYQTLSIMRNFQLNKENNLNFPKTDIDEFNYMNGILKQTSQKAGEDYIALKEFTENASHELQTPLSIISSKLDLLIQNETLSEHQAQTITGAYAALKKMTKLNQSLLLLAKIGNRQYHDFETILWSDKVKEKMDQFQELWADQHIQIEETIQESLVFMNPDLSDILINNLFSNATRHNIPGGYIRIELKQGFFRISNSGAEEPLDSHKIFKRFYKSDQSSSSNGLGLSIIKQICDVSEIKIAYQFKDNFHAFTLTWTNSGFL